jgi:hypothetical protein
MNNFYQELNFNFTEEDRTLLSDLLVTASTHAFAGTYQQHHQDEVFFQTFLRDWAVGYMDTPLFTKLADLLSPIAGFNLFRKAQIVKITGALIPHVDARSCVLTIPLMNTIHPITWYDADDHVIQQYNYTTPVLINTHIRHGCQENTSARYLFQVGIDSHFGEFADIKKLIGN